ncbi:sensor histidine kinase, partial [Chloroflexota bacterium]
RKRLRENMQFYISEVTKAQEEERRRIARELHDETVQSLASLVLDIEAMSKDESRLSKESILRLEQLKDKTRSIMKEVRRYSHELRPDILDKLGLIPALELLTAELNKERMIKAGIEVIGSEQRLSSEAELVLFRITQEAVRNVWRHSQAKEAVVRVEFKPNKVKLTVTDNGTGFKVPGELVQFASEGKLGLCGMQERIRLLGGRLSVESQSGKGTTITAEIELLPEI